MIYGTIPPMSAISHGSSGQVTGQEPPQHAADVSGGVQGLAPEDLAHRAGHGQFRAALLEERWEEGLKAPREGAFSLGGRDTLW
jgi:hypothetical protein